jgi:hypothetical protein
MSRVVNTDNFGGDCPDEYFESGVLSEEAAQALADHLNEGMNDYSRRYRKVVPDNYELAPGFEP